MTDWVKVGTDVVVGGGVGAVDQLLQNQDDKRAAAAPNGKLSVLKQYGTYYNYGVPLLSVLGVAFGFLRGDWATRAVVAGSQLAGRKVTKQVTKKAPAAYSSWQSNPAAKAAAAAEARRRAMGGGGGAPVPAGVGIEF
ncbi:hypothetical protein ES707_01425 [subsurface metagenome]